MILYQDESLIIVEKPAGTPSCGDNSLETELQKKFPTARLVHRLDNETSGLMVAALTEEVWKKLREIWKTPQVVKKYTALVVGRTAADGEITNPIAHHHKKKKKMEVGGKEGQTAQTNFKTLKHLGKCSLLEVTITTGVRHQIRVHLASIGHPVVGDKIYLRAKHQNSELPKLNRHFLHLSYLKFFHPITGKICEWKSALPQKFIVSVRHLRIQNSLSN
ncbi:MAG: RluA family pseudouridine synthase [Deltaproteobacteria bacterium]|nr:RluA family pseudouridine synthase [Deltaproteobacteria bacterium]